MLGLLHVDEKYPSFAARNTTSKGFHNVVFILDENQLTAEGPASAP